MTNVFVSAVCTRFIVLILSILFLSYVSTIAALTNPTVAVQGEVLDSGNKPSQVLIQVVDAEGNVINRTKTNSKDGKFYISGLACNKEFTIKVLTKNSKLIEVRKITTPNTSKFEELSIQIKLNHDLTLGN